MRNEEEAATPPPIIVFFPFDTLIIIIMIIVSLTTRRTLTKQWKSYESIEHDSEERDSSTPLVNDCVNSIKNPLDYAEIHHSPSVLLMPISFDIFVFLTPSQHPNLIETPGAMTV